MLFSVHTVLRKIIIILKILRNRYKNEPNTRNYKWILQFKTFLFLPQFFSPTILLPPTKKKRKKRAQGRRRVKERPWIQGKKHSTVVEASLAWARLWAHLQPCKTAITQHGLPLCCHFLPKETVYCGGSREATKTQEISERCYHNLEGGLAWWHLVEKLAAK